MKADGNVRFARACFGYIWLKTIKISKKQRYNNQIWIYKQYMAVDYVQNQGNFIYFWTCIPRKTIIMSKHPETDFSGNRKICFQSLIHFYLCPEGGIIRHELLKYFVYAPDPISNSVFHQQRSKFFLKHSLSCFSRCILIFDADIAKVLSDVKDKTF